MKSKDILYGNKKKLTIDGREKSLFADSECVNTVITIRNEIIHNSSYDNLPKVYQVFESCELLEKFILLPDMENGKLAVYKNRRRFFGEETKINEILPSLLFDFWKKLSFSLEEIKTTANN